MLDEKPATKQPDEIVKGIREQYLKTYESVEDILELVVKERTRSLEQANQELTREIAERIKIEEALRLSGEIFRKAFNCSPQIISISTVSDGKYLLVNDAFTEITGHSKEETIGRTAMELNIWADLGDRDRLLEIMARDGKVRNFRFKFGTKSGQVRLGLYSAELVEIEQEMCMIGATIDITDHYKLEKEMTRIDRLNLIGQMAASIGHEIRNPMTSVRGFLQIMGNKKEYAQDREFFDLMIEELDRANTIITEFLLLARNKAIDLRLQNLNEIILSIDPLIQAKAIEEGKQVLLELNTIPDLWLDEKEIRQLLYNLARNALEAMAPGGIATIRTFSENDCVVLSVHDQGPGIVPQVVEKLGVPFTTTKENRTGLGLSACFSIAVRHNAQIDMETCQEGTTVFVRFNS
jgi:PAS domain S-box-containing protein